MDYTYNNNELAEFLNSCFWARNFLGLLEGRIIRKTRTILFSKKYCLYNDYFVTLPNTIFRVKGILSIKIMLSISETPDKHSKITLLSLTTKVNDMLILIENQEENTGIQKNINNADQKGKVNERIHQPHRALDEHQQRTLICSTEVRLPSPSVRVKWTGKFHTASIPKELPCKWEWWWWWKQANHRQSVNCRHAEDISWRKTTGLES